VVVAGLNLKGLMPMPTPSLWLIRGRHANLALLSLRGNKTKPGLIYGLYYPPFKNSAHNPLLIAGVRCSQQPFFYGARLIQQPGLAGGFNPCPFFGGIALAIKPPFLKKGGGHRDPLWGGVKDSPPPPLGPPFKRVNLFLALCFLIFISI
jgi:hypothetical protein